MLKNKIGNLFDLTFIIITIDYLTKFILGYFPFASALLTLMNLEGKEVTDMLIALYTIVVFAYLFKFLLDLRGDKNE